MQVSATSRRNEIEQQAADYITVLAGDPDTDVRIEIARWIEADAAHAVAFARAEAAWELTARMRMPQADEKSPADLEGYPSTAEASVDSDMVMPSTVSRRRMIVSGIAASCAALAGVSLFAFRRETIVSTRIGEMRDVVLPDGSQMHLNTASEAEMAFSQDRRLVRLIGGEAFFHVRQKAETPFYVDAAGAIIQALASSFNVRLRPDLMEVVVTEGAVAVRAAAGLTKMVKAGEAAFVRASMLTVAPLDRADLDQRTAWRDHVVELNGETLVQAVQEFNRYRAEPLIVGDPRIGGYRVGGRFNVNEVDQFLAAMVETFPIRTVKDNDGSVLLLYRDEDAGAQPDAAEK